MKNRITKRVGLVVGTLVITGLLTGTAVAVLGASAGGGQIRIDNRTETAASLTSSTLFNDLPGASVAVSVPAGQSRLIEARFTAESQCAGPNSGYCSLRMIATNVVTGATFHLNPQSGIDYAFDSDQAGAAQDLWEGNAMDRSIRLPGGTYRIRVQRAVSNNTVTFRLDDWHLAVQTNV
jgi:hypothetical protein